jgi:DNA-binding NarL/FixJ family response regulator
MSTTTLLPLLVLSPNTLFRDCLVAGLAAEPGFAVHAAGGSLPEALQAVLFHRPEVVVVDSSLAGCCELIEGLARLEGRIRVVVVGLPEDDEAILSCIERGAAAYVLRGAGLAELRHTLNGVIQGEFVCSPRLTHRLIERVAELSEGGRSESPPVQRGVFVRESAVTPREAQILELIAEGLSNKEIAGRLYLSLATVKNHVHNILDKLGVSGRYAAVAFLREQEVAASRLRRPPGEPRFGRRREDVSLF